MTRPKQLRPHCYGQAASFSTAKICKQCPDCVTCAQSVMTKLEQINERLDVSDIMRSVQTVLDKHGVSRTSTIRKGAAMRFAKSSRLDFEVEQDLSRLSTHSKRIATTILKRGINMKADARQKVNHLKDVKPTYLFALQEHLNSHGQITVDELQAIVGKDRNTNHRRTIRNHVSYVTRALVEIGVLDKVGERDYVLSFD